MFSSEELSNFLIAVSTGYDDRARNAVLMGSNSFEDDLKSELDGVLSNQTLSSDEKLLATADLLRVRSATTREQLNQIHRAAFYCGTRWQEMTWNPFFSYFLAAKNTVVIDKWIHYFDIYERYLSAYRGEEVRVLEIGTDRGAGLVMLSNYLGPDATIIGLDVDKTAAEAVKGVFHVVVGDQEDPETLARLVHDHGPFDIVIDDGGHRMSQQIAAAEGIFPSVRDGGIYITEDTHTSYWSEYGGGPGAERTFSSWIKDRIDDVNGYHAGPNAVNDWTRTVNAIHIHGSMVVIERGQVMAPFAELSGTFQHLREDRETDAVMMELVASRDAALDQLVSTSTDDTLEIDDLRRELADTNARLAQAQRKWRSAERDRSNAVKQLREIRRSASWRYTAPARRATSRAKRAK